MRLRYAGSCRECGTALPVHHLAYYEPATKTVRCLECPAAPAVDDAVRPNSVESAQGSGVAGASARRKYERLKDRRERTIRSKHPRIGGLILAWRDEPQSIQAWELGAEGEEKLGALLDSRVGSALAVLHDRAIPGGKANIDHIAVTPAGVWVIDAKHYEGRPELRTQGGIFRPRVEKLTVGGRNCTKLVDGMLGQMSVVRAALPADVVVNGVLCFVDADWPVIAPSFTTRGVDVVSPRRLLKMLGDANEGPVDVTATRQLLKERFGPR